MQEIDPNKMLPFVLSSNAEDDDYTFMSDDKGMYCVDIGRYSYALKCVRCNKMVAIVACDNCTGTKYRPGYSDSQLGLFCLKCKNGFTRWECTSCGTDNPVSNTVYKESKSGCFIATACYGDYVAPEVMVLRQFRDKILLTNFIGESFVRFYYAVSPPIANFIVRRTRLRKIIKLLIVEPAVKLAGWIR